MVRERIRSWINAQSTGRKIGVILLALFGLILANRSAVALEGAGDVMIVVIGIPTIALFAISLYSGAIATLSLIRNRGSGEDVQTG